MSGIPRQQEVTPDVEKIKLGRRVSKEHVPDERTRLVAELRQKRKEYFDEKRSLGAQIEELVERARERQMSVENVRESIIVLENEFSKKNANILTRVLNYTDVKRIQSELGRKIEEVSQLEGEFAELQSMLASIRKQAEDRTALSDARQKLRDFYGEVSDKWRAYEHERKVGAVENISSKYDIYVIHALHPAFVPGSNSRLYVNTRWEQKLDIVLALQPDVSVSTIKVGDGAYNMWARVGLILGEGHVSQAYSYDAATVAQGLTRAPVSSHHGGGLLEDRIETSITGRHSGGYNELVVEDPTPVAFYYSLDDTPGVIKPDRMPPIELMPVLEKLEMPPRRFAGR